MVSRGAERPGDVRLAPTGAERRTNPPLVPRTKEDDAFDLKVAERFDLVFEE